VNFAGSPKKGGTCLPQSPERTRRMRKIVHPPANAILHNLDIEQGFLPPRTHCWQRIPGIKSIPLSAICYLRGNLSAVCDNPAVKRSSNEARSQGAGPSGLVPGCKIRSRVSRCVTSAYFAFLSGKQIQKVIKPRAWQKMLF
jgi:hypothetical protein